MLQEAVKFLYYDLAFRLMNIKEQNSKASAAAVDESKADISRLRQNVTEYLRLCELLLIQSPHKKVSFDSYKVGGWVGVNVVRVVLW